jgi:glycosyltransferase involved in cell wall biosynthesis
LGLGGDVHWIGARSDVPQIFAALDLAVLCSTAEGFPNVLAESMACGTPCVSTDVGSAREIIAAEAPLSPAGDAAALAGNIVAALNQKSRSRTDDLRQSIISRYSVPAVLPRLLAAFATVRPAFGRGFTGRDARLLR